MKHPSKEKVIFHVDMDAFYASVEQYDHPEYRGRPLIVGGASGKRGVVSACSYEARKYGIHSAMPVSWAKRLCPQAIFVPVNMRRYQEVSRAIMKIFDDFTPEKIQISVDEAFLDMSGTERLFGPPGKAALLLKERVKTATGLTLSVGIAHNHLLAKLASDFDKPDGLVFVKKGEELAFLDKIDLKDIWGLGKKTLETLHSFNITTVQQLRETDISILQKIVGKAAGDFLYKASRGIDPGIYTERVKNRSISSEVTFEEDTRNIEGLHKTLLHLADQIMFRLLEQGYVGKTVFIKLRYSDFSTFTARQTLKHPLRSEEEIHKIALDLLKKKWDNHSLIRLVGLGVSSLEKKGSHQQIELFCDAADQHSKVENAVQIIRSKGRNINKASLIPHRKNGV